MHLVRMSVTKQCLDLGVGLALTARNYSEFGTWGIDGWLSAKQIRRDEDVQTQAGEPGWFIQTQPAQGIGMCQTHAIGLGRFAISRDPLRVEIC